MTSNLTSDHATRRLYGSLSFVVAVFALSYCALTLLFAGQQLATCVFIAGLATLLFEQLRRRKIRQLEQAIASADRRLMNEIFVNGRVGEINDADYFSLKLEAILDARAYVAQSVSIASFVLRCLIVAAVFVPIALFWWFVLGAWFAPAQTLTTLASFYKLFAQAPTIGAAVPLLQTLARTVANVGAIACVISASVLITFTSGSPIRNAFRESLHWRLRRLANCAAEGNLHVEAVPATTPGMTTGVDPVFVRRTRVRR